MSWRVASVLHLNHGEHGEGIKPVFVFPVFPVVKLYPGTQP
jgi:hypothetical protein